MRKSSRRTGVMPAPAAMAPPAKSSSKEFDKCDTLFSRYAEKNDKCLIGPEGIEALCRDLQIEPTDMRILLLAWKFGADKQGFFTLEEWRAGLKALKADTLDKLKKALANLQQQVADDEEEFKSLYSFSFQYCLTEPRQKTLDLDSACQMLELILSGRPHLDSFTRFLQEQKEYKGINHDQWIGFLRFCDEVSTDMSNYDETQAWPLLLDNYVEWSKQAGGSKEPM
ncbi:DCN1-like protein 5 isoform X2 [Selaginella moellendorffii]|uniref:DCN1-like protein 5 isoform X2 n=1 Tax=Selaginella moellendorffii TaxID=88036 RepID=UPI000D1C5C94|nr:DCN1-like protein 5 isoform X2 [Selaginella moellendorffii]XP_024528906.1 DCN1-like protein 5 isoform X2 [Selaginella moellendorffii]|eukprot:XP_024526287.1 DCN1-like protein 5 isoform X2 [Selaginella moellendorffii]